MSVEACYNDESSSELHEAFLVQKGERGALVPNHFCCTIFKYSAYLGGLVQVALLSRVFFTFYTYLLLSILTFLAF